MARPFVVQHFVFCELIDYRNRARPHRNTILDGVDFVFGAPAGTEFPFDPDEFWLFARFYSTSDQTGDTRPLSVVCYWLDSPTGEEEVELWTRHLGPITFRTAYAAIDRTWVFRNPQDGEKTYRFLGPGRYVFRLGHATKKYPNWRVKATEYIQVEAQP